MLGNAESCSSWCYNTIRATCKDEITTPFLSERNTLWVCDFSDNLIWDFLNRVKILSLQCLCSNWKRQILVLLKRVCVEWILQWSCCGWFFVFCIFHRVTLFLPTRGKCCVRGTYEFLIYWSSYFFICALNPSPLTLDLCNEKLWLK